MCSCFLRCFLLRLVFGLRSYSLRHFRVWSPGSRQGCLSQRNQKWRPWRAPPSNRSEFAETNPPGFYGKSDWNRGNKSSGVLWQIQFNWPTSELGQGGSGAETFLECSHKKCLKRGKQRNVDRGHTNGTLNKWTKMFLHLEEKSNFLFNHLISIGTKWSFIFMSKTLDFFNFAKACFFHYHKQACLL